MDSRTVERFIDYDKMKAWCTLPIGHFQDLGEVFAKDGRWYCFIDNGGKHLAVAHLDSVIPVGNQSHFEVTNFEQASGTYRKQVWCPHLDDRLGVYTILHLLPKMGMKFDVLLTIDEETGRSSAQLFDLKNHNLAEDRYNWIFQFDATGGSDAKTYGFGDTAWHDLLKTYGFTPTYGSFTDITYLEDLKVKGVNVACAYYNYHSQKAYMNVDEYCLQINRFRKFWKDNQFVRFPHEKKAYRTTTYYSSTGRTYAAWQDDDEWFRGLPSRNDTSRVKRLPSSTKDNRPTDFDWISDTTKRNVWVQKVHGVGCSVYTHNDSRAQAIQCSTCEKFVWLEEVSFFGGHPICSECRGIDVALTTLQLEWLAEGGILIRNVSAHAEFRRDVVGQDEKLCEWCEFCGNPEWKGQIRTYTEDESHRQWQICRECEAEMERAERLAAINTDEAITIYQNGNVFEVGGYTYQTQSGSIVCAHCRKSTHIIDDRTQILIYAKSGLCAICYVLAEKSGGLVAYLKLWDWSHQMAFNSTKPIPSLSETSSATNDETTTNL